MSVFRLAAQVAFNTVSAVRELQNLVSVTKQTAAGFNELKKEAEQLDVPVSQLLRLMEAKKGTTELQKNVKLATSSFKALTGGVKEARLVLTSLHSFFSKFGTGGGVSGVQSMTTQFQTLGRTVVSVKDSFSGTVHVMLAGLEMLSNADFGGLESITSFFHHSLKLAGEAESSRVTFDTLLGDAQKSNDLLQRLTRYSAETPFTRPDIIESSKMLLNITKGNVEYNEKLVKLSGQVAALKPGTQVQDVARGMFGASMGEFDILKHTFGFQLNADKFKKYGEVGGAAYTEAVVKEIEKQLAEKTGGRDLVKALGQTLIGKLSTLSDNFSMVMETFGEVFLSFGLKDVLDRVIPVLDQFNLALRAMLFDEMPENFAQIDGTILNMAAFVVDIRDALKQANDYAGPFIEYMISGFRRLDYHSQHLLMGGLLGLFFGGGISAIGTPIIALVTTIGAAFATVGFLLGDVMAAAMSPVLVAAGIVSMAVLAAMGILAYGFAIFKKSGESTGDALKRLGKIVWDVLVTGFEIAKAVLLPIWNQVFPALQRAFILFSIEMDKIRGPLYQFFGLFGGSNLFTLSQFANLGQKIGMILAEVIGFGAKLAISSFDLLFQVLDANRPLFAQLASDIMKIGKAFVALLTGTGSATTNFRTFIKGIADVATQPIRLMLLKLEEMLENALRGMADTVRPFSSTIAGMIDVGANKLHASRETLAEGFLATDRTLINRGQQFDVSVMLPKMDVLLDGNKVGQGVSTADTRARNSGRGGNPVDPAELGFVLEGGGSSIRTVDLNEVAGSR